MLTPVETSGNSVGHVPHQFDLMGQQPITLSSTLRALEGPD